MTIATAGAPGTAASPDTAGGLDTKRTAEWSSAVARAILGTALLVGIAADALLRHGLTGLGFPLWIAIMVFAATSLVWRSGRRVPHEARAWLATAMLFSTGLAWRDSGTLQFLDFVTVVFGLAMSGIALSNERAALFAARMRDTVWAGAHIAANAAVGVLPLALRELFAAATPGRAGERAWPLVRAAAIAAALLFVFGSLLRSADPIFAGLVALPDLDVGLIGSHVLVIGFFTWIVAGWARGALLVGPGRRAPDALPFSLGSLDVTTALGTLNLLFALFVLSQLGWFFGGENFLRERTGLTAAAYARQGFFEMVWVVVLVILLLVGMRVALRPGRSLARRHTALSLPLIALLGAIVFSATMRMRLYVHYYGLTTERFYPLVFMGWLALVLPWLAVTVLRGRGRPFIAGVVLTGLATLAALNLAAPDAIVARVNVSRAAGMAPRTQPALDLYHLASLSAEAVSLAIAATLAPSRAADRSALRAADALQRCAAASNLLDRWGPSSVPARRREQDAWWRNWNIGEAAALRVVGEHAAELRGVARATCPQARRRAQR
jgi:hypothetical protein